LPPVSDADDDAFLAMLRDSSFGTECATHIFHADNVTGSGSQRRVLGEDVTRQHFEGWLQVTGLRYHLRWRQRYITALVLEN
jgi:hypothetical protein